MKLPLVETKSYASTLQGNSMYVQRREGTISQLHRGSWANRRVMQPASSVAVDGWCRALAVRLRVAVLAVAGRSLSSWSGFQPAVRLWCSSPSQAAGFAPARLLSAHRWTAAYKCGDALLREILPPQSTSALCNITHRVPTSFPTVWGIYLIRALWYVWYENIRVRIKYLKCPLKSSLFINKLSLTNPVATCREFMTQLTSSFRLIISCSISLFQPSISANLFTVSSRSPSSMWSHLRNGTFSKGPTACRFKRRRGTVERTVFTRLANGSIWNVEFLYIFNWAQGSSFFSTKACWDVCLPVEMCP